MSNVTNLVANWFYHWFVYSYIIINTMYTIRLLLAFSFC